MLGFDALGRISLGQISKSGSVTLTAAAGSYTVTGVAALFKITESWAVDAGDYLVTGSAANLCRDFVNWLPKTAQSETWTAQTAQSESWTPKTAQSETWTARNPATVNTGEACS